MSTVHRVRVPEGYRVPIHPAHDTSTGPVGYLELVAGLEIDPDSVVCLVVKVDRVESVDAAGAVTGGVNVLEGLGEIAGLVPAGDIDLRPIEVRLRDGADPGWRTGTPDGEAIVWWWPEDDDLRQEFGDQPLLALWMPSGAPDTGGMWSPVEPIDPDTDGYSNLPGDRWRPVVVPPVPREITPRAGTCRVCGCTEEKACAPDGCGWTDATRTLCTSCGPSGLIVVPR